MVFLKVVLVGLASPRGLTVQCFPQEYFSPTPPFHFRCVGPYKCAHLMIFDRPQGNAGAAPPDRAAKQRRPHRPPLEKPQNFLRRCAPLQS